MASLLGQTLTLILGVLLVRHRELIAYFKGTFSFIRDDFDPYLQVAHSGFLAGVKEVIQDGVGQIESANTSPDEQAQSKIAVRINRIIVLTGRIIILLTVISMLLSIGLTIWMIYTSQVTINL
ncbi:MAG: hypothetical protein AAFR61_11700 [Bacteroidota bacterium]